MPPISVHGCTPGLLRRGCNHALAVCALHVRARRFGPLNQNSMRSVVRMGHRNRFRTALHLMPWLPLPEVDLGSQPRACPSAAGNAPMMSSRRKLWLRRTVVGWGGGGARVKAVLRSSFLYHRVGR